MLQFDFSLPEAEWLKSINAETTWQKEIVAFVKEWCSEAVSFAIHTSGSTGTPKVVEHLRDELMQSALRTNHFFKLNHTSVFFLCIPVQHVGGRVMLVRAMLAKAKIDMCCTKRQSIVGRGGIVCLLHLLHLRPCNVLKC